MKAKYICQILIFLLFTKGLFAQIHVVPFGDERYMDCVFKGFYTHCIPKKTLSDGKWIFNYPETQSVAMITHFHNQKQNGIQYRYREDGTLVAIDTYKDGRRNGESRVYYPNGQVHFKSYFANGFIVGEFWAFDTLGNIGRHEIAPMDSSIGFRKEFNPVYITDIEGFQTYKGDLDTMFSKDSLMWMRKITTDDFSIYSVQSNSTKQQANKTAFIGQQRDSLLTYLGTDYYIMTDEYVEYAIDSQKKAIHRLNDIPLYILRCYFDNNTIRQIIIIENKTQSYSQIIKLLKERLL